MKNYYRVMLGRGSSHFQECYEGNFIGTDFEVHVDLTNRLPEEWRKFNKEFIPIFLQNRPEKSKISAGLACGALWTVSKGIKSGDRVLCPDGGGRYHIGEVSGDYHYVPDEILPHRRRVVWLNQIIDRADMSTALKNSTANVLEELAEENQTVRGAIIALDDDLRIRRALQVTTGIDFYRYEISFTLKKA